MNIKSTLLLLFFSFLAGGAASAPDFRTISAGNIEVVVHPETPEEDTEEWISKNIAEPDASKEMLAVRKLVHDSRPIRVKLLKGKKNAKRCVMFHNPVVNGQIEGMPKDFASENMQQLVFYHESYHCDDFETLDRLDTIPAPDDPKETSIILEKYVRDMEIRADVWAAVRWIAEGGDIKDVKRLRDIRIRFWALGDYKHDSSRELRNVISDQKKLEGAAPSTWKSLVKKYVTTPDDHEWKEYRRFSLWFAHQFAKTNGIPVQNQSAGERGNPVWVDTREIPAAWKNVTGNEIRMP